MLRWGLAFVFFYAALEGLLHRVSIASVPPVVLSAFSAYELLLAGWLFWGEKLAWSSMFAAVTLAAFTIFILIATQSALNIFPAIGLAMAALALFELARVKGFKEGEE